jgi:hypothetical protein
MEARWKLAMLAAGCGRSSGREQGVQTANLPPTLVLFQLNVSDISAALFTERPLETYGCMEMFDLRGGRIVRNDRSPCLS